VPSAILTNPTVSAKIFLIAEKLEKHAGMERRGAKWRKDQWMITGFGALRAIPKKVHKQRYKMRDTNEKNNSYNNYYIIALNSFFPVKQSLKINYLHLQKNTGEDGYDVQ
jgi:hypothetical protein